MINTDALEPIFIAPPATEEVLFDLPTPPETLNERVRAGTATDAEKMQYEMAQFTEDGRRAAAAEVYAKVLATIRPAYINPHVTSALRDGIEISLGLKSLPKEQGEQ